MKQQLEEPTDPITTPNLIGHDEASKAFIETVKAQSIPHAWLLCGPKGIGKMTLAYHIAWFQLFQHNNGSMPFESPVNLQIPPGSKTFLRVKNGNSRDLRVIERITNPVTKKLRGDIVVDQIRELGHFFSMTSAENGWRVAIIDAAEDMNTNAANALLKLLEEPPERSLILLVSHAPVRLLPTIKSRCRHLMLRPLDDITAVRVLQQKLSKIDPEECLSLVHLSEGCPGKAIAIAAQGGLRIYKELIAMLSNLPDVDYTAVHALGDQFIRPSNEAAYQVWFDLFRLWISRLARGGVNLDLINEAVEGEIALVTRLTNTGGLDRWVSLWEKIGDLAMRAERVNLDRKQIVLNAFMALESTARN